MKLKKIITVILTSLAALMAAFSGVMKLTGSSEVVKTLTPMGVADYFYILGIMEIAFAILFVIPKTFKLGFILLSCYFAGALATEISHAASLNALTPLILIWTATFLRDKNIFLPTNNTIVAAN